MNKQGWSYVPINDVAEVNTSSLKNSTPKDLEFDYIDIASITRTGVIGNAKKLTFGEAPSRARRIVHIGDTIISTVRPYLKAFAFINKDYDRQVCSTGFVVLTPKETKVDPKYLYQTILSDKFVEYTKSKMTGSNYPAINAGDVKEYRIYLPPLQEQKKIADILSSVDEAIERTEEIIEQTEQVKKGLMQQLLTKGIGHTRFKRTEIGEIPCDWERVPLKNLVEENRTICYGVLKPGEFIENGIPMLRVVDLGDGKVKESGFHKISKELDKEYSRSRLKGNEVLISLVGTIGRIAVTESYHQFMNVHRNIGIIPVNDKKINKRYLAYMMQSEMVQKEIKVKTTGGSQPLFNIGDLKELTILLPSLEEQSKIVDFISSVDKKLELEKKKQLQLEFLKVGLMQSLLTGKVRVKVNGNEEIQV
ncbi:TPA: restriction endonuclease subunit S [Bacillus toyonensis]|nr:restriction endonuclease subunit S [Bacillus toyonensis]